MVGVATARHERDKIKSPTLDSFSMEQPVKLLCMTSSPASLTSKLQFTGLCPHPPAAH